MRRREAEDLCSRIQSADHEFCRVVSVFELADAKQGYFGELWLKPLRGGRDMEVVKPFGFVDSQARKWEVPVGTKTDGASIPRALWSLVGSPFTGAYREAAVIHDRYCQTKLRSWSDTHDAFYEAMLASGVDKQQALLMWAAVYRFGPRWTRDQSVCWGACICDRILLERVTVKPVFYEEVFNTIKKKAGSVKSKEEFEAFLEKETFPNSRDIAEIEGVFSGDFCGDKELFGVTEKKQAVPSLLWRGWGFNLGEIDDERPPSKQVYKVVNVESGDRLMIRNGPGRQFAAVGSIPAAGTGVLMEGKCELIWCKVSHGNTRGWVNGKYLTWDREESEGRSK
jgi:hypothetical protein